MGEAPGRHGGEVERIHFLRAGDAISQFARPKAQIDVFIGKRVDFIETADGVRNTALAAAVKLPVSAIATKVRNTSRSSSGMG